MFQNHEPLYLHQPPTFTGHLLKVLSIIQVLGCTEVFTAHLWSQW